MLKLLQNKVDGEFYYAIKSLYKSPKYCVQVNEYMTNCFNTGNGVKQGDAPLPTLFANYINDLLTEIEHLNLGIEINENLTLSILAYADDLVVFSDDPAKLQALLDHISNWCQKWWLKINVNKTKVIQFRMKGRPIQDVTFNLDDQSLELVKSYKYLGVIMDEHLEYDQCIITMCNAAKRALGKIIYKGRQLKGLGFETYSKFYH